LSQQHSRNGDALLLPAAEPRPALADLCRISLVEAHNEIVGVGCARRSKQILLSVPAVSPRAMHVDLHPRRCSSLSFVPLSPCPFSLLCLSLYLSISLSLCLSVLSLSLLSLCLSLVEAHNEIVGVGCARRSKHRSSLVYLQLAPRAMHVDFHPRRCSSLSFVPLPPIPFSLSLSPLSLSPSLCLFYALVEA